MAWTRRDQYRLPYFLNYIGDHDAQLSVNLDNLLIQLRPHVTHKWYAFGEAVCISKDILDNYGEKCAPDDCIIEVLDYWLRHSVSHPTWKDVAQTLLKINLQQLAQEIDKGYTTGM